MIILLTYSTACTIQIRKNMFDDVDDVLSDGHVPLVISLDTDECLMDVNLGKAAGIDGLAAEHFLYSHSSISVHLALLFSCLFQPWVHII